MLSLSAKKIFFVTAFAFLGIGILIFLSTQKHAVEPETPKIPELIKVSDPRRKLIGTSVEERPIEAYTFGHGTKHIIFVGGVHGGYEWNSVLLAYKAIDYLTTYPESIPETLTVDIIPSANPDGIYTVTKKEGRFTATDVSVDAAILASGRFNARDVDINRNFDCKWQPKSTWRSATVSAGTSAFSEPEAEALRTFIQSTQPVATVFWHSQSNGVYASHCGEEILPATLDLMKTYAQASGYPAIKTFDAYEVTGAADDWLAKVGIPAVTVELSTHSSTEWERNLSGIQALLNHYK